MSAPILINGVAPPGEIVDYDWGLSDLDGGEGTGRSEVDGIMFRDRIARCRRLTIAFGPTSVPDMSELLKLVRDEFVKITYLDAFDGGWRTDEFYVADRGVQALQWDGDVVPGVSTDFSNITWGPCTMEFTGRGNPIE